MYRIDFVKACVTGLSLAALMGAAAPAYAKDAMSHIQKTVFGHAPDGAAIDAYTLTNKTGMEARIMTWGATLVSLKTPDRHGHLANVVLGFDNATPYITGVPFYGATIGRFANRIAGGTFKLDGKTYQLPRNDGTNSLHGGTQGFDKRLWKAEPFETAEGPGVKLTYVSADGEEGYPGQLTAHVSYQLRNDDALDIKYEATTTKPTPLNLTNHAYFNLSGDFNKPILDEVIRIDADRYTPVNDKLIPTGELAPVAGTPFDFRKPMVIGARINEDNQQLKFAHGYDDNWVLNKPHAGAMTLAAVVSDPGTGRSIEVKTTEPGIQFYTGNFMDGKPAGKGTVFQHRTGLTLETQHFPDSPNQPTFPSTILKPGQTFRSQTVYLFRTVK
ncbi:MAG: galactose mutarotase [Alphaproteobacteria bacterium]|nr:galactose mutarotase [Alphaproteobacteria bacterium]